MAPIAAARKTPEYRFDQATVWRWFFNDFHLAELMYGPPGFPPSAPTRAGPRMHS